MDHESTGLRQFGLDQIAAPPSVIPSDPYKIPFAGKGCQLPGIVFLVCWFLPENGIVFLLSVPPQYSRKQTAGFDPKCRRQKTEQTIKNSTTPDWCLWSSTEISGKTPYWFWSLNPAWSCRAVFLRWSRKIWWTAPITENGIRYCWRHLYWQWCCVCVFCSGLWDAGSAAVWGSLSGKN